MIGPVHQIIERTEPVLKPNVIIFYLWLLSKYPNGATIRSIADARGITRRSVQRKSQFLKEVGYLKKQNVEGKMIYKPIIKKYIKVAS